MSPAALTVSKPSGASALLTNIPEEPSSDEHSSHAQAMGRPSVRFNSQTAAMSELLSISPLPVVQPAVAAVPEASASQAAESPSSTPAASPRGDSLPPQHSLSPRGASTASSVSIVQRSSAPLPVPPLNLSSKSALAAYRSASVQERGPNTLAGLPSLVRPPMLTPAQTFQQGFQAALQLGAAGSGQPHPWQQPSIGPASPVPLSDPRFSSTIIHSDAAATGPHPANLLLGASHGSLPPVYTSASPQYAPAWQHPWLQARPLQGREDLQQLTPGALPTALQHTSTLLTLPQNGWQGSGVQQGGTGLPPTSSATGDGTHRSILSTSTHSTVPMDSRTAYSHASVSVHAKTVPSYNTTAVDWKESLHTLPASIPLASARDSHTAPSGSLSVNQDVDEASSMDNLGGGESQDGVSEEVLSSAVLEDLEAVWANHQKLHLMVQTLKGAPYLWCTW
jgi:hypothetical protein